MIFNEELGGGDDSALSDFLPGLKMPPAKGGGRWEGKKREMKDRQGTEWSDGEKIRKNRGRERNDGKQR